MPPTLYNPRGCWSGFRIARYGDLDRHLKTLDEKLEQLEQWKERQGQGMTSAELERAAAALRLAEEGEVA